MLAAASNPKFPFPRRADLSPVLKVYLAKRSLTPPFPLLSTLCFDLVGEAISRFSRQLKGAGLRYFTRILFLFPSLVPLAKNILTEVPRSL